LYDLTSLIDFGPQTCNKSNRKWKSLMSFGVMILSPPQFLLFHFFVNLPTQNAKEFQYTYILTLMDVIDSIKKMLIILCVLHFQLLDVLAHLESKHSVDAVNEYQV